MSRYSNIPITRGPNPIDNSKDNQPRYLNVKYPEIARRGDDIYIFTRVSDRYDVLAQSYYNDSSLYWIISTANYNNSQASLLPAIGTQIRIPAPSRISQILSDYENLNR